MTANASFYVTEQKDIVMVPAKAIHFTPDPEALAAYNQGIADSNRPGSEPQAPPANREGAMNHQSGNGTQTVWIKQGAMIHPHHVTVGVTDEVHYEVLSGLKEGDEVVVSMTTLSNGKAKAAAVKSPFMPQRPGSNRKTTK